MTFYFKPKPGAFKDNILRIAPDLLPPGSIKIDAVWINGNRYADFDAEALTVKLPEPPRRRTTPHPLTIRLGEKDDSNAPGDTAEGPEVRVRIVPAGLSYNIEYDLSGTIAQLTLDGTLDDSAALALRAELNRITATRPKELALQLTGLRSISGVCARALALTQQNLDVATTISVVGATPEVKQVLGDVGLLDAATVLDADSAASRPGRGAGHSTPRPRQAEPSPQADVINRQR
jgi:anti-anti-sigma regulatory factor